MQRIFYCNNSGKMIIDVSGGKTAEQIEEDFLIQVDQEITIDEKEECPEIIEGSLRKKSITAEVQSEIAAKKSKVSERRQSIKSFLNINDSQLDELVDLMNML